MAKIVTRGKAMIWLRLLAGATDKEVGFVCGELDDESFFLVSKGSPETAFGFAKQYEWKADPKDKDKKKKKAEFTLKASGSALIDSEGVMNIKFKKISNAKTVHRFGKEFWKTGFGIPTFWSGVKVLDEDVPADFPEGIVDGEENLEELPDEQTVLNRGAEQEQLPVQIEESGNSEDPDDEFVMVESPVAGEGDGTAEAAPPQEVAALDKTIDDLIQAELKKQVALLFSVAGGIGMALKGTAEEVAGGLYEILKSILLANPPPTMEKAANWLARFQLAMNSSTDTMRGAMRAGRSQKRAEKAGALPDDQTPADDQARGPDNADLVPGVDLNKLSTDDLGPEEVVDALFKYGVGEVTSRNLPYDVSKASFDKIDKIVRGSWPRAAGPEQLQAIDRLQKALQSAFVDDGRLINYLGLEKHKIAPPAYGVDEPPAYGSDAMAAGEQVDVDSADDPAPAYSEPVSEADRVLAAQEDSLLIEPRIADLKYNYAQVAGTVDKLIVEAENALFDAMAKNVKDLGGSWDEVRQYIAGLQIVAAEAALGKVVGKVGSDRRKAAEDAKSVLDQQKSLLSHRLTGLLDASPFGTKPEIQSLLGGSYEEAKIDLGKLAVMQMAA